MVYAVHPAWRSPGWRALPALVDVAIFVSLWVERTILSAPIGPLDDLVFTFLDHLATPRPSSCSNFGDGGRSADVLLRGLGTYVTGCDRRTATYLAVGGYSSPPIVRPAVPGFGRSLLD